MNIAWIKLDLNILDDNKIKVIRKYPGGSDLIVFWLGLLLQGMRAEDPGRIMIPSGTHIIEYFSTIFDLPIKVIELGLGVFEKMEMVGVGRNFVSITNFRKHQAIDQIQYKRELGRLKVAKHRADSAKLPEKVMEIEGRIKALKTAMIDQSVTVTKRLRNAPRVDKNKREVRLETHAPDGVEVVNTSLVDAKHLADAIYEIAKAQGREPKSVSQRANYFSPKIGIKHCKEILASEDPELVLKVFTWGSKDGKFWRDKLRPGNYWSMKIAYEKQATSETGRADQEFAETLAAMDAGGAA